MRRHVERGWCYRALEAGQDPTRCLFPRPVVGQEAEEILGLVRLCGSQLITDTGHIIGIDWNVVRMVAVDLGIDPTAWWYGVEPWWKIFRVIEAEWVEVVNKPRPKTGGEE